MEIDVPQDDIRGTLAKRMSLRDRIETDLISLHADLKEQNIGMTEPLVDDEGYPRNDIDIYHVCLLRQEINCKENYRTALTDEIERCQQSLQAEENFVFKSVRRRDRQEIQVPFASVDLVHDNSPAQKADLCVGDLIVKFGSITSRNYENLTDFTDLIDNSLNKPIHVSVLRNDELVPLILIPHVWSGNGHLGLVIRGAATVELRR